MKSLCDILRSSFVIAFTGMKAMFLSIIEK